MHDDVIAELVQLVGKAAALEANLHAADARPAAHPTGEVGRIDPGWVGRSSSAKLDAAAAARLAEDHDHAVEARDEATDELAVACTAPDFDTGTYQPNAGSMSAFVGGPTNGKWRLRSQASFWPGYGGEGNVPFTPEVYAWCLTFTY